MAQKLVSWTLNVIREIEPAKLYGVGVSLSISTANPTFPPGQTAKESSSRVVVSAVHPSGPASTCLKSGDIILAVDETCIDDKANPQDVAKLIRGPEGSEVIVVIYRNGKKMEFTLTRERIGQMDDKKPDAAKNGGKEELKLNESVENVTKEVRKLSVEDLPVEYKKHPAGNADVQNSGTMEAIVQPKEQSQDLTSSNESSDIFIDQLPPSHPLPRHKSFESHSEEKSHDELDNCSIVNSVDGEHWEILSAASGSAVMISFTGSITGSLRSASPSMLSNKFIMTESTGEEYIEHVVLPTDTLQGICLAYKLSATRLRMVNGFSGNSLQMAPKKLRIPANKTSGTMIRTQDRSSKEFKLYAFCAELPSMELVEAKAYLDLSAWDLEEAVRSAREDDGWNLRGEMGTYEYGEEGGIGAVARPKALTANDVYAAPPPFEGAGFELKDIN